MSRQSHPTFTVTARASGAITACRAITFADAQATTAGEKIKGVASADIADGKLGAVHISGTVTVEAGDAVSKGDSLIVDSSGRAIPSSGALGVASGATAVTSTAADGAILEGAELPEYVFADALEDAAQAGDFIEVLMRR